MKARNQRRLTAPRFITIQQLVSDYFLVLRHEGYSVVKDGQILGMVTLQCASSTTSEYSTDDATANQEIR